MPKSPGSAGTGLYGTEPLIGTLTAQPQMLYFLLLNFHLLSRRSRASWHPSAKPQCFATFAKTDLGILQENINVLPFFTWHPSKPRNIHACLPTPNIRKNTLFFPLDQAHLGILQNQPISMHVCSPPILAAKPPALLSTHCKLLSGRSPAYNVLGSKLFAANSGPLHADRSLTSKYEPSQKTPHYPALRHGCQNPDEAWSTLSGLRHGCRNPGGVWN
ncbi:MAG: hypothetical protein ACP5O1_11025, partial [Phycisphaerae bacterium]